MSMTHKESVEIIESTDEEYVATSDIGGVAELIDKIQAWGIARNITAEGGATSLSQMKKLQEELDELKQGLEEGNSKEIVDGIGDMLTVLIQICRLEGLTFGDALTQAWNDIKDRRGRMVDGVFVKETPVGEVNPAYPADYRRDE